MTETSVSVSVVIPVYNEQAAIDSTVAAVHEHLGASDHQYEIIVVDDGSTDASRRLLADRTDCRVIHHETNRGYGAALKTGIRHAKFSMIAIVDTDGTYSISGLPELIDRTMLTELNAVEFRTLSSVIGHRSSEKERDAAPVSTND